MWYSLHCLHSPQTETGTLSDNSVSIFEQVYQPLHHSLLRTACPAKTDSSHCPHIGVPILKQLQKGFNHSRSLECTWCVEGTVIAM